MGKLKAMIPPGVVRVRRNRPSEMNTAPIAVSDLTDQQLKMLTFDLFAKLDRRTEEAVWIEAILRGIIRQHGYLKVKEDLLRGVVDEILASCSSRLDERRGNTDTHLLEEAQSVRDLMRRAALWEREQAAERQRAFDEKRRARLAAKAGAGTLPESRPTTPSHSKTDQFYGKPTSEEIKITGRLEGPFGRIPAFKTRSEKIAYIRARLAEPKRPADR